MHVRSGTTVVSLIRANLERLRLEAARIITGLPIFTNTEYLYRETGWERLEERRTRRKLQLFYNIQNGSTPPYSLDLITPTIQSTTIYPLRNGNDIIVPFCRLSLTSNWDLINRINTVTFCACPKPGPLFPNAMSHNY